MTEKSSPAGIRAGRHIFRSEDVAKAHSPEALERRRRTLARRRENRLRDVADCRRWGMVPGAIADYLEISDLYVKQLLREAERRKLL